MEFALERPVLKRMPQATPQQERIALKPCKCCGQDPSIFWGTDISEGKSYWWARCKCGATAPWAYDRGKAAVRWNRSFGKAV